MLTHQGWVTGCHGMECLGVEPKIIICRKVEKWIIDINIQQYMWVYVYNRSLLSVADIKICQ